MQHISLKLLKPISIFYSSHSVWLKAVVYIVCNIAQVTLWALFIMVMIFFFFFLTLTLLVFNLHPQKHSKHLLESNGIYNAVFGKMQNKQALYSLRPHF